MDEFIGDHPEFMTAMEPIFYEGSIPAPVLELIQAGKIAKTGPMAGIAGLFSKYVADNLVVQYDPEEIIVENGGDIYAMVNESLSISVYAGKSELSGKIKLEIKPGTWGICTSSGTVGHSISYGNADAVTILSHSPVIADTLATGLGNMVKTPADIDRVLKYSEKIEEILGIVIIIGDRIGIRGDIQLA